MYGKVKWRPTGIPTKEVIREAASTGWSSRKDQDCLAIYNDVTYEESIPFLKRLISWGHTSILEHIVFKFSVKLSVACAAQVKTYRMATHTQKSFRITRKFNEDSFIVPLQVKPEDLKIWTEHMIAHFKSYEYWLDKGYSPDVARFQLPHGAATHMAITLNARSLRNVLKQRHDSHAMFEFQDIMKQIVVLIKQEGLYFLFEDIVEESDLK